MKKKPVQDNGVLCDASKCKDCIKHIKKLQEFYGGNKCEECLAYYKGKHTCDGLMKILVSNYKKKI